MGLLWGEEKRRYGCCCGGDGDGDVDCKLAKPRLRDLGCFFGFFGFLVFYLGAVNVPDINSLCCGMRGAGAG